jgi:hypothetical protein
MQDQSQLAALEVRTIRPDTSTSGNKKANRIGSPFIPFQLLIKAALMAELVELSVCLIT